MKIEIYEQINKPTLLLIEGLYDYQGIISYLKNDYTIILACVDTIDIDHELTAIEELLIEQFDGLIDCAYGSSIGAHLLMVLVQNPQLHIKQCVYGSPSLKRYPAFIVFIIVMWQMHVIKLARQQKRPILDRIIHFRSPRAYNQYRNNKDIHYRRSKLSNDVLKALLTWHLRTPWLSSCEMTYPHFLYSMKMGKRVLHRYLLNETHTGIVMLNQYEEEMLICYPMRFVKVLNNTFDPQSVYV